MLLHVVGDGALSLGGSHFLCRLTALATWLSLLVSTGGLSIGLRPGGPHSLDERVAAFVADVQRANAKLSLADRTLGVANVILYNALSPPASWFDVMSAASLRFAETGALKAQLDAILGAGQFAEAHNRAGAGAPPQTFRNIIDQTAFTVGEATRDIQNTPILVQSVVMAQWVTDSKDPQNMTPMPAPGQGIVQLYRRALREPERQFTPLFIMFWSTTYAAMRSVLTDPCSNEEALGLVASSPPPWAAAQELKLNVAGDGITQPTAVAVNKAWAGSLATLDSEGVTGADGRMRRPQPWSPRAVAPGRAGRGLEKQGLWGSCHGHVI